MPHEIETRRIVADAINQPTRTNGAALARSTDSLSSDAKLNIVHYRCQLKSDLVIVSDVDNAAKGGGAKLFDFPDGYVTILGARIEGSLTTDVADLTSTAGELGLGTTVASGAVAVLGGTAGFENILEGAQPALSNFTAGNDLAVKQGGGIRAGAIGAFGSAAGCFLNVASTWGNVASAADVSAKSGMVIEVWALVVEA